MGSQDDDNTGLVLGLLVGLITLVIAFVIGIAALRGVSKPAPVAQPVAAIATDAEASILVQDGLVTFFFASGKAALAGGANEALANVVKAVAEGKKAVLSGFHDATGDPEMNVELAKQRAFAVRDALTALGVAADKIELKKPENTLATGADKQARRVEVAVQ
ncbi:MAG: OmpA family protein [Burkholderiales bacterium]|nr:OmpA family protein [Burkholderiales bacterium]